MFLVIAVKHYYDEKMKRYLQEIDTGLFDDFHRAKEYAKQIYEDGLYTDGDFVVVVPCLAYLPQRDSSHHTFSTSFPPSLFLFSKPETGGGLEEVDGNA